MNPRLFGRSKPPQVEILPPLVPHETHSEGSGGATALEPGNDHQSDPFAITMPTGISLGVGSSNSLVLSSHREGSVGSLPDARVSQGGDASKGTLAEQIAGQALTAVAGEIGRIASSLGARKPNRIDDHRQGETDDPRVLVVRSLGEVPPYIVPAGSASGQPLSISGPGASPIPAHQSRPRTTSPETTHPRRSRRGLVVGGVAIMAAGVAGTVVYMQSHHQGSVSVGVEQLLIPGGLAVDAETKALEPLKDQPLITFKTTVDGRLVIDMTPDTKKVSPGITGNAEDEAFRTHVPFEVTIRITAPYDKNKPENSAVVINEQAKSATVNLDKVSVNVMADPLKYKDEIIPAALFNEQLTFTKEAVDSFLKADAINKDFAGLAATDATSREAFKNELHKFYEKYEKADTGAHMTNIVMARGLQSAIATKGDAQTAFVDAVKLGIAQAYWANDRTKVVNVTYKGWSQEMLAKVAKGAFEDIARQFPVSVAAVDLVTKEGNKPTPPEVRLEPVSNEEGV